MKKFFIGLSIGLLILLLFFWFYFPTFSRYRELKDEQETIEQLIDELDVKIAELEQERQLLLKDKEYIEKVIREELGLVKPGEVIYKFVPKDKDKPASGSQEKLPAKPEAPLEPLTSNV